MRDVSNMILLSGTVSLLTPFGKMTKSPMPLVYVYCNTNNTYVNNQFAQSLLAWYCFVLTIRLNTPESDFGVVSVWDQTDDDNLDILPVGLNLQFW